MAHHVFKLPDIGEGTAEVELTAWMVQIGDQVEEDQPIADVMTDKATMELPSPVSGRIVELHGTPGERRAVGSPLAVIDTDPNAAVEAGVPMPPQTSQPPPEVPSGARSQSTHSPAIPGLRASGGKGEGDPELPANPPSPPSQPSGPPGMIPREAFAEPTLPSRPIASPAVRRLAWELGVELRFVPATGPASRITRADIEAYREGGGRSASPSTTRARRTATEEVKVTGLRRVIAERMSEAKRRIPHFSYIEEVDVTALEELRATLNAEADKGEPRLTVLPFLVRALARALPDWPQINARYDDEAGIVTRHGAVHVGIATQTPTGLVVPVLRHAESFSLGECAAEVLRLSEAARSGAAKPAELAGSTITITSLGPLGGLATTPVINRPEVAIVGVNKIVERPVVRGGAVVIRRMMNLSSSFDHRVVDGWDAAEFVQRLRTLLEQPARLFMDGEV